MITTTACPLDCYDACRIVLDVSGGIKGDKTHPVTRGHLCSKLNHFDEFKRLLTPRYKGHAISIDEAIDKLYEFLTLENPLKTLYYRGSGNLGVMQRSMDHFFAQFGATGTHGSLCDGAGEAGIIKGRGVNYALSPAMIEKSDIVIVWGRNIHSTHSHLLPFLKQKKLIVIDPLRTRIADMAYAYIPIKPHCDIYLALLLSRLVIENGAYDGEFLKKYGSTYGEFYTLAQTIPVETTLKYIGITRGQIDALLEIIFGKKVVVLVGAGVQKYQNGNEVLRCIDGLATLMGWFGKVGCGVSFLGDSSIGLKTPFETITNTVAKPTLDFSQYTTALIQGANPLAQMPNSSKVFKEFGLVKNRVYFGLYENESSKACDLVIPAKTFLEKDDFRASYGDFSFQIMSQLRESSIGISEYALSSGLCSRFGFNILSYEECLRIFRNQIEIIDGVEMKKNRPIFPYSDGFETNNREFVFINKVNLIKSSEEGFFLITSKYSRGLNSQFHRASGIFLHPQCGFKEGEKVKVSSKVGETTFIVQFDERLRYDCALIYAGTPNVNMLTPSLLSYEGNSAVYQEFKIEVKKI
jgi:anaerobic selenocysteine-containing dehydrogenase